MAADVARTAEMQVLLRDVNENVRTVSESFGRPSPLQVVCECGNGCGALVTVDVDDYERVRKDGTHFLIAPGHLIEGVDRLLESHEGWAVVEAVGTAAEIARRRSST